MLKLIFYNVENRKTRLCKRNLIKNYNNVFPAGVNVSKQGNLNSPLYY